MFSKQNLIMLGLLLINGGAFWVAIATDFLIYRRVALSEALLYLSIYQLLIVILEFPTGVIGDKFGHKFSIICGTISTSIGLFLLAYNPSIRSVYYIALFIISLGFSLVSGSDMALLSNISSDFKKQNSKYTTYGLILQIIVISTGSVFYKLMPEAPFLLNILFTIVGGLLILFLAKNVKDANQANVFAFGKKATKYFFKNTNLLLLTLSFSFLVAAFGPIKWIISTIFTTADINAVYWGSLFCFLFVGRIIGTKIYSKTNRSYTKFFVFAYVISFLISIIVSVPLLSYAALFLMSINYGVLENEFTIRLSDITATEFKASVFSMRSFISRLASSLILYIISIFSVSGTYTNSLTVLFITSITMLVFYVLFTINSKHLSKLS
jgi:MFS family permease